jgi:hypothetical protein
VIPSFTAQLNGRARKKNWIAVIERLRAAPRAIAYGSAVNEECGEREKRNAKAVPRGFTER